MSLMEGGSWERLVREEFQSEACERVEVEYGEVIRTPPIRWLLSGVVSDGKQ
jgi:hypothetical protein